MSIVHCPSCGSEILDLGEVLVTETSKTRCFQQRLLYDLVIKEKEELQKLDVTSDYRFCKALAACYELQEYLADCVTVESSEDC